MTDSASISVVREGNEVVISGGGTLDLTNYQEFHDGLKSTSTEADSLTVDLRAADFIDTAVVQDLARAAVTLLERGKRLKVLVSETKYPLRVIQISGFEQIMDVVVEPDEEKS